MKSTFRADRPVAVLGLEHFADMNAAAGRSTSLGRSFGFHQFRCTRPGQLVVGGGSSRPCRTQAPAASKPGAFFAPPPWSARSSSRSPM